MAISEQTGKKRKAPRTAFKPGQSGNPGGRPQNFHSVVYWMRRILEEGDEIPKKEQTRAYDVALAWIKKANNGDMQAIKEINDRTEGKAPQSVTLKGDVEEPLHVRYSEREEKS